MVPVNLKLDTGEEVVQIPESWNEVTFDQFLEMYNSSDNLHPQKLVSIFTKIPVENLGKYSTDGVLLIIDTLLFTLDYAPIIEAAKKMPDDPKWKTWKVGEDEWGKLEAVRMKFKELDQNILDKHNLKADDPNIPKYVLDEITANRLNAAPVALKEYADIDTSKTSVIDCYGLANFFLIRLEVLLPGSVNLETRTEILRSMRPELMN
jgi:hypothetical protein